PCALTRATRPESKSRWTPSPSASNRPYSQRRRLWSAVAAAFQRRRMCSRFVSSPPLVGGFDLGEIGIRALDVVGGFAERHGKHHDDGRGHGGGDEPDGPPVAGDDLLGRAQFG